VRTHGTASAYNGGCRCDDCKASHRDRIARQKLARKDKEVTAEHGKVATYRNWSCRCRPCMDAAAATMREYEGSAARVFKRALLKALTDSEGPAGCGA
jgi:hypothetical protein